MYFLQLKCKDLTCGSEIALVYANIFFLENYLNFSKILQIL